jgi:hypothetical protein
LRNIKGAVRREIMNSANDLLGKVLPHLADFHVGPLNAEGCSAEGIEALDMMRKGQVKRLDGRDSKGQAKFVESLFGAAV